MVRPDVLVVGAGVSGLTTALSLARSGLSVRVVTRDPPRATTSAAAGASWGPYLVDDKRVLEWSEVTRGVFEELAQEPTSGVHMVNGIEATDVIEDPPSWATGIVGFQLCTEEEVDRLPRRYVGGWRYTIPLIDMPVYLDYLSARLSDAGVSVEPQAVSAFGSLRGQAAVVVNCTGLDSRDLVPDAELSSVRGQVVVMENPGIHEFFQDNLHSGDITYILPHGKHVILGGCATSGPQQSAPIEATTAAIIARCAEIEPKLRNARFIEARVGFRPTRKEVRVERADMFGTVLVHNYGHGGSGVTLSWGCAERVCQLIC